MKHASIGPISVVFPPRRETNQDLQREFPNWDLRLIEDKTGIAQRFIAAPEQTAADLAVEAGRKLLDDYSIDAASIDFLLFCTQTPDYPLPTTACLMQQRLGMRTSVGALDFNLGCSGFVYGLALADGMIRTGAARRVLLVTAETYSKYIDAEDRSLRTIFGDGAAATLIEAGDEPTLSGFQFGTDGSGADTLLVNSGGARPATCAHQPRHRQRWKSALYMDGPSLMSFTVAAIPVLVGQVLEAAACTERDVDLYLFHQATLKMLEQLRVRMDIAPERMPVRMENCGNTVSATIPILIQSLRREGELKPGMKNMLVGFGVGWSWAGCMWNENWAGAVSASN
ncbi:MAG: ketoacyl-ACP synthase III [Planctomycetales bacterium]|nr:ketoacyl-ACP synthase III [Planctomycetales bacterium]